MPRKNNTNNYIEDLTSEEDYEHDGICEDISGTPVSSFSFTEENNSNELLFQNNKSVSCPSNNNLLDNRKLKTQATVITPDIDGEPLDTQRCYKIRNSTARMLNEIKAAHPDVNVYMNTIVDSALRHYYDYIFNNDGLKTL